MKADRVFLDANIFFSVAYGSKGLTRLWELSKSGVCVLLASEYVIKGAERNLHTTQHIKSLNTYLDSVQIVPEADQTLPCPIELPEKDRPVFMAAAIAKADFLITGDITHFGEYFGQIHLGVNISTARDYLRSKE